MILAEQKQGNQLILTLILQIQGRINVDLLPLTSDDHPRPLGAIDRMEEFHVMRRKDSSSSAASSAHAVERLLGYSPGQPGPIMKVKITFFIFLNFFYLDPRED